jgi:hypothetical protein
VIEFAAGHALMELRNFVLASGCVAVILMLAMATSIATAIAHFF